MQFLNPLLLIGAIAIAVPIAVHLFNFRRYKKLYFSNIQFLKEIKQETRKQSNLLHRLILASRILAFLFVVLAFAQPVFLKGNQTAIEKSNIISVFLDNSFSMESQGTQGTLLDEAKEKAAELANAYRQDDQFQLLTNDFEAKHQRLVSREEFLTMLTEIEPSASVRSLKEISSRQNDVIKSGRMNAVVHYISDFQKSTLLSSVPDSGIASGFIIPVLPASLNNLFIDSCWFSSPVLQLKEQAELTVKISNVSETKLEKIPVKLMIEGAQRAVASIDIDPESSQELTFSFTNDQPGFYKGFIEINDYPVTYDDIYYFTYHISPRIPVLCINEENPDDYITSVYQVDSIIDLTNTPARQIDLSSFKEQRLIILNQLNSYSSGLIQEVTKFVENGGSLIVIPSFSVAPQIHNALLNELGTDVLAEVNPSAVKVSDINTNHPIYADVFESGSLKTENIDLPIVSQHFTLRASSVSTSETLLELANEQPLLTYTRSGSGKVYLFSSTLTEESGNFVRNALFVPTMLNIAFRSEKLSPLMNYTDINSPIQLTGVALKNESSVKIEALEASYSFIPEVRQINGLNYMFINGQVQEAGFYKVIIDDKDVDLLAFNYNRRESVLNPATISDLLEIADKTGLEVIESSPKPLDKVISQNNVASSLWKWFIVAALVSILAEVLLISFFKTRTRAV